MENKHKSFVDIIIPTFNRYDLLKCMLYSLVSQYDPDWTATVVIDNVEDSEESITIVDIIKKVSDSRIRYINTDRRYNDCGHTPRELGKQMSESEYIVMSGEDNYYTPNFVQTIKKAAAENNNPVLLYWNMVHSYRDYDFFECFLFIGGIDMGAFATRSDVAKTIPLGVNPCADGLFIEKLVSMYPNTDQFIKLKEVLFVHN